MIRIGKPRLVANGDQLTRLVSDIRVDNEIRTVWAEVDNKYKDYLCYERSDAFVVGLLHYAMRHNHDIVCEAPMGEYLYYQLTTCLIDAVSKGSPRMHRIHIEADIDGSKLPCAGKVGTGISCGIDSLHVLACQSSTPMKRHNITHLAFNNVGSHGEGERAKQLFAERRKHAENFCQEYGFELTEVNSNLMDEFEQNHFLTHTYSSSFAIYVLQKLYAIYYYASSDSIFDFSLKDNDRKPSGYYEALILSMFSTDTLRIYCEGETSTRQEKVEKVVQYIPSYKYLNVCTSTAENCSRCEKCTRTLLALDVLGKLEAYRDVFDINYYNQHKQHYLKTLVIKNAVYNGTYMELYPYLKKQILFTTRIKAIPWICKEWLLQKLPQGRLRNRMEKIYHLIRG